MAAISAKLLMRARFDFALGSVYVTDNSEVGGTAEVRVLDWGSADQMLDGGEDHVELTLSNVPISSKRFSENWSFNEPPEGVIVTIEWSHAAIGAAPAYTVFFQGAISEVSSVTELEVKLQISELGSKWYRDVGDPITRSEWPQAAEGDFNRAKPIVIGTVKQWTPPLVRQRKKTTAKDEISATQAMPFDLEVENSKGWPTSGTVKIDDEHFLWDNTFVILPNILQLTARAQNGTEASVHDIGSPVVERALQKWLVADHPSSAITAVYGVASNGKKVLLDASVYSLDLGAGADYRTTATSTSLDEQMVALPTGERIYRRIDLDTAEPALGLPNPGFPSGFAIPNAAKNPALAAGDAGEWGPDSFAVMYHEHGDTLALRRSATFEAPKVPFERAWLCVEHFGLRDFGKSAKLTTPLGELATSVFVSDTKPFFMGQVVRCQAEEMTVLSVGQVDSSLTVLRAASGTVAVSHPEDARIVVVISAPTQGLKSVYPIVRLWLETGVGTGVYTEVGKLIDVSQIPAETKDESKVIEASVISAFHGHPVSDSVFSSGLFPTALYDVAADKWQSIGSLAVATVKTSATEDTSVQEPLSPQVVKFHKLSSTNTKIRFTMNGTATSLNTSYLQKIQALRVRVVHAASGNTGTVPPSTIRVRLWIGGSVPVLSIDAFLTNDGALVKTKGPRVDTTGIADVPLKFPNGLLAIDLFSKSTSLIVEFVTNDTDLYHVAVDCILEEQQLIGNSAELVSDRSVVAGRFDCVLAKDGSYANGVTGVKNDIILELVASQSHYYLLSNAAGTFRMLGPGGTQQGLVMLAADATAVNETKKFNCYWVGVDAPSDARVVAIVVTMDIGTKSSTGNGQPIVELINETTGEKLDPQAMSMGKPSAAVEPAGNYTRTSFWFRWSNDNESIGGTPDSFPTSLSVFNLLQFFRIRVTAGVDMLKSTSSEIYINAITYRLELETSTGKTSKIVEADQFTRVQYFDLTASLTDYADIQDRRTIVQFQSDSVEFFEDAKPLLIHRVFWLFRHFQVEDEPLDRIACDMTGLAQTDSVDWFRKILSYGYPLLSVPAVYVSENALLVAKLLGALPLNGVIEETEPARDLLNRLAAQARCSFLWISGNPFLAPNASVAALAYKPDLLALPAPVSTFSHTAGDMMPDTFKANYRTKDSVSNFITVRGDKDYADGSFRLSSEKKWNASIAKFTRRPFALDADWLVNQTILNNLTLQQIQYRHDREIAIRFMSPPSSKALTVSRSQIIHVIHPNLANGFTDRAEVVGVRAMPNSLQSGSPPMIEISAVIRPVGIAGEAGDTPDLGGNGT